MASSRPATSRSRWRPWARPGDERCGVSRASAEHPPAGLDAYRINSDGLLKKGGTLAAKEERAAQTDRGRVWLVRIAVFVVPFSVFLRGRSVR